MRRYRRATPAFGSSHVGVSRSYSTSSRVEGLGGSSIRAKR